MVKQLNSLRLDNTDMGVKFWGHTINLTGDNLNCTRCDMEEEVPEVFKLSSGFKEAVYRLYIYGKFKNESCATIEDLTEKSGLQIPADWTDPISDVNKDRVNWIDGNQNVWKVDTGNGTITTDGRSVLDSTDPKYRVGMSAAKELVDPHSDKDD